MKQLFVALMVISTLLSSCKPVKKRYVIEVTYFEGQKDTLSFIGVNKNMFRLENGDLKTGHPNITILSGVRQFNVLQVDSLGIITLKEAKEYRFLTIEKNKYEENTKNF